MPDTPINPYDPLSPSAPAPMTYLIVREVYPDGTAGIWADDADTTTLEAYLYDYLTFGRALEILEVIHSSDFDWVEERMCEWRRQLGHNVYFDSSSADGAFAGGFA